MASPNPNPSNPSNQTIAPSSDPNPKNPPLKVGAIVGIKY